MSNGSRDMSGVRGAHKEKCLSPRRHRCHAMFRVNIRGTQMSDLCESGERCPESMGYVEDGNLSMDNSWMESRIRPGGSLEGQPALRWITARRQSGCRHHEPDPIGQAQRARTIPLPREPLAAIADAAGGPSRGIAVTSRAAAQVIPVDDSRPEIRRTVKL